MFLNENVLYREADEVKAGDFEGIDAAEVSSSSTVDADPATFTEAMYFAEKAWNTLSMKMVRLEHTAIVNNDRVLMEEGQKSFGQKVVQWFKDMWAKIKAFVDKIVAKIQGMIDSKREKQFAHAAQNYRGGAKVSGNAVGNFYAAKTFLEMDVTKLADSDDNHHMNQGSSKSDGGSGEEDLSIRDVKAAYTFLINGRRQAARNLTTLKTNAQKIANEGIAAAKKADSSDQLKAAKEKLSRTNSIISSYSAALNRGVSGALTIMTTAARNAASSTDRAVSQARDAAASGPGKSESASILDQF